VTESPFLIDKMSFLFHEIIVKQ